MPGPGPRLRRDTESNSSPRRNVLRQARPLTVDEMRPLSPRIATSREPARPERPHRAGRSRTQSAALRCAPGPLDGWISSSTTLDLTIAAWIARKSGQMLG